MCPVTLQEMNGAHAFIVLFNTGWVMAEKATKEVGLAGLQVTPQQVMLNTNLQQLHMQRIKNTHTRTSQPKLL